MFFGQSQECWDAVFLVFITAGSSYTLPAETHQRLYLSFGVRRSDVRRVLWLLFRPSRGMIQCSDVTIRQSELIRLQPAHVSQHQAGHKQGRGAPGGSESGGIVRIRLLLTEKRLPPPNRCTRGASDKLKNMNPKVQVEQTYQCVGTDSERPPDLLHVCVCSVNTAAVRFCLSGSKRCRGLMSSEGLEKWDQACWFHPYCVQGSGTEG